GHARAATITDLEQLAQRYQALHATADPAALLTPVAAHIRMAMATLGQEHTAPQRRRLLRNLATVATLAGRLAYEDLGDAASGRSYYSLAADSAREADDHQAAATALGYTAQLAHAQGMTAAALNHLSTALTHAEHAPTVPPWLATIQATIHADSGDHTAAAHALNRAKTSPPVTQSLSLIDHSPAHLLAATGHVHLQAGDHRAARAALTAAFDQLPSTACRARIITLTDLAMAELRAGNLPDACRHAITAQLTSLSRLVLVRIEPNRKDLPPMLPIRAVWFDLGEVLINETHEYGTWADWLGIPAHLFGDVRRGHRPRRGLPPCVPALPPSLTELPDALKTLPAG
ncbi:MAG TPA: tetratricopeptide repeat protein, partial [Pseudonocardiaceae bacterium]